MPLGLFIFWVPVHNDISQSQFGWCSSCSQAHKLLDVLVGCEEDHGGWDGFDAGGLVAHVEASYSFTPVELSNHVPSTVILVLGL